MRPVVLVTALVVAVSGSTAAAEITALERQRLLAHMDMTSNWLFDEVSRLSDAQVSFRRAPNTWSILEVVEHLVLVGPIYWDDLQRSVQSKPSGRDLRSGDALILWYGIDRTYREPALTSESATGELKSLRAGLDDYRTHHARLVAYVKTTKDDLRDRFVPRQGCDAYQWALLISTHEQRHILQIREIKADPTFPAK